MSLGRRFVPRLRAAERLPKMISVNGVAIEQDAIGREMQHHPGQSRDDSERQAATALVIRELLVQRARQREIAGASEDERIANLVEQEVRIPEPTEEEVARYYRRNTLLFMTSPLYEAAHIFFPARQDDEAARAEAKAKAEVLHTALKLNPSRFGELAKQQSACSSKALGGSLGQVTKGDTNPELERAMAAMDVGSMRVVESRHGYHLLLLDRRVAAKQLPLEQSKPSIENRLRTTSKRRAVAQYLQLLAAGASIEGIELAAADSPLVQ
jgi:peptidyl-prolyl cis-trans isomerase C